MLLEKRILRLCSSVCIEKRKQKENEKRPNVWKRRSKTIGCMKEYTWNPPGRKRGSDSITLPDILRRMFNNLGRDWQPDVSRKESSIRPKKDLNIPTESFQNKPFIPAAGKTRHSIV